MFRIQINAKRFGMQEQKNNNVLLQFLNSINWHGIEASSVRATFVATNYQQCKYFAASINEN